MKYHFFLMIFIFGKIISSINGDKSIFIKLLSQLSIKDEYKKSIFGLQLRANNPCEDSFFIQNITLLNIEGVFFSIFDGHGGDTLSKFANILFYPYFLEFFNLNKFIQNMNDRIIISLKETYHRIEIDFLKIAFNEKFKGNKYSFIGSCALSAIIINNKIFISNLGDSKARLYYLDKNKSENNDSLKYNVKKLSKVYNIRKKSEQNRMKKKYPNDNDILRCYGHKSCYIKGILQPTRSLGDYILKYLYFSDLGNNLLYEQFKKYYEGPYISSKPDIQVFNIKENYKYLIIGSDGLWDVIKSREIGELLYNFTNINNNNYFWNDQKYNNIERIAYGLIHTVLINYSKERNKNGNYQFILDTPFGEGRRSILDDITIITCDLSKYN